jgi:hypothetical protein
MRPELRARMEERLRHELEKGELEAPWARFPIPATSIGWRMGPGESWRGLWSLWMEQMTVEDRRSYLRRQPPAPYDWAWALGALLFPDEEGPSDARGDTFEWDVPPAPGTEVVVRVEVVATAGGVRTVGYPTEGEPFEQDWVAGETTLDCGVYTGP